MAPIIRTCSLVALLSLALPGVAEAKRNDPTPLGAYLRARVLDASGDAAATAAAYDLALTANPGDVVIAVRAYRRAIEAGDERLALRAATALRGRPEIPPDARLLLIVSAAKRGDLSGALRDLDAIEQGSNLDFLVPSMRGWLRLSAGSAGALEALTGRSGLSSTYARETRALLLLATGQVDEGVSGIRALATPGDRQVPLRLAAAALVQKADRARAVALLEGADPALTAARARIGAGRRLGDAPASAASGLAFLFARVGSDILVQDRSMTGLALARLASFADPGNDAVALVLARALSLSGQPDFALAALTRVDGPLAVRVPGIRADILARAGRDADALKELAAGAPDSSSLVLGGDIHGRAGRFAEAAKSYRAALDAEGAAAGWQLWIAYGSALDQAGDWPAARAAFDKALLAAPDEPGILNQFGYSLLERREDLAFATQMIAKANRLQPDNAAIIDSLGWAFHLRGRTAEAIVLLERAVTMRQDEPAIGEHLGDAYWAAGRKVEARYAWTAAMTASADDAEIAKLKARLRDGPPQKP